VVSVERIHGALGRRQNLDVEFLKERTRPERAGRERGTDGIEIQVGCFSLQAHLETEDLRKHLVEPKRRSSAAKQFVVTGE
jgi:hypothetical protein